MNSIRHVPIQTIGEMKIESDRILLKVGRSEVWLQISTNMLMLLTETALARIRKASVASSSASPSEKHPSLLSSRR